MSSTLIGRIGEGLVIGITASVAFWIFDSMNNARLELSKARETLDLQVEVNQGLLDQSNDLKQKLDDFESRLTTMETDSQRDAESLNDDVSISTDPTEVSPTSNSESSVVWSRPIAVGSPSPRSTIQHRIDEQKQISQ